MNGAHPTVVLFDIDGTILWTDGAGRRAVQSALEDGFGAPVPQGHEFDGKTEQPLVMLTAYTARQAHSQLGMALKRHPVTRKQVRMLASVTNIGG